MSTGATSPGPTGSRGGGADRLLGALTLLLAAGLWALADTIPASAFSQSLEPGFFPKLVAALLLIPAVGLLVRPGPRPLAAVGTALGSLRLLAFAALLAAYALAFPLVDFRLSTWIFCLGALALAGGRRPLELALFPPLTALVVDTIFRHGFSVQLPQWTF